MIAAPPRRIGLGTVDIGQQEVNLVKHVLMSGQVSPGPMQRQFETAVAKWHGKQHATFVNSGQSALHLSLEVLKRHLDIPKLRVLVPAVTYISTLHAVWNAQCDVVLADVDPVDWLMDPRGEPHDVRMPVDLFGKACITRTSKPVIEDACEAIGAPGVGYGDLVCLSFYASHSITTGSGGMVMTDSPVWDAVIKRLANHGRVSAHDLYTMKDDGLYDMSRRFVFDDEGWSFKSSDLNAALGLGQMDRLDGILTRRRTVGLTLLERLGGYAQLQLANPDGHTFQMFPIVCREAGLKPRLVAHLNDRGIETRDAMPIVTQPVVIDRLGVRSGMFPVADHVAANGFYIGCHQHLCENDLDYVADAFSAFFRG